MTGVTIMDGPVGTELHARGVSTTIPLWSAAANQTAPDVVRGIHRDYVSAGATVHVTNTFRTQPRWMGDAFADSARRAVTLAREAGAARVAGSLAPVEDCYRPDLSPGEAAAPEHARLAEVLAAAGCDLLLVETFPVASEAWAAVEACVATGMETWAAFTAGPAGDLMTPREMQHAAEGALRRGASHVMVNCTRATLSLPFVESLCSLGAPAGVYANAGEPNDDVGWTASDVPSARRYADLATEWVEAGATLIGGCCGTGPAHIRELARRFA